MERKAPRPWAVDLGLAAAIGVSRPGAPARLCPRLRGAPPGPAPVGRRGGLLDAGAQEDPRRGARPRCGRSIRTPLFPYLLGGPRRPGRRAGGRKWLRIALACLVALTLVVSYTAGRRGLGRAEGVVAGLLAAACGPLIFTDVPPGEGSERPRRRVDGPWPDRLGRRPVGPGLSGGPRRRASPGGSWPSSAPIALVLAAAAGAPSGGRVRGASSRIVGLRRPGPSSMPWDSPQRRAVDGDQRCRVPADRMMIPTTWQAGANFYIGNGPEATGTYMWPHPSERPPTPRARPTTSPPRPPAAPAGRQAPPRSRGFWLAEGSGAWARRPGRLDPSADV